MCDDLNLKNSWVLTGAGAPDRDLGAGEKRTSPEIARPVPGEAFKP
jgi:hypothetical protein